MARTHADRRLRIATLPQEPAFLAGLLLVLAVLHLVLAGLARDSWSSPEFARLLGYPALVLLLVAYVAVYRRLWIGGAFRSMTARTTGHIVLSFAALGFTLLHSQGRAGQPLPWVMMLLFWLVVVAGVIGLAGQRLGYRLMPLLVERELGPDQLEPERRRIADQAERLAENSALLVVEDVRDWSGFCAKLAAESDLEDWQTGVRDRVWKNFSGSTREFVRTAASRGYADARTRRRVIEALNANLGNYGKHPASKFPADIRASLQEVEGEHKGRRVLEAAFSGHLARSGAQRPEVVVTFARNVADFLVRPFPTGVALLASWAGGLRKAGTASASGVLHKNYYARVLQLIGADEQGVVRTLWELGKQRRQMDREYLLHRAVRAWVPVHAVAAVALLILVLVHAGRRIWFGGL